MAYITKKTTVNGVKPIGSNLFGICNTASDAATKVVTMSDFDVLVEGVTIHVYFTNANTASNATLQVGSTSARNIYYNGTQNGSWEAGGFISFTYYNGSWIQNDVQEDGVTYTFTISGHTITISGSDGSAQTLAIPDEDTTYALSLNGRTLTLTPSTGNAQSVALPDDDTTYTLSKSGNTITLTGSDGSTTSVTDDSGGNALKYTKDSGSSGGVLQNDVAGNTVSGSFSLAEGLQTTASGVAAHAEGQYTNATNDSAHAEGYETTASGAHSHAEGYKTTASNSKAHAEGDETVAGGNASHAEGYKTQATGSRSHAQNYITSASKFAQTVIGSANVIDASQTTTHPSNVVDYGQYAFIIGNGTSDANRSNAFAATWDGDVHLALDTNAVSGVDYEIYSALTALGWDAGVII